MGSWQTHINLSHASATAVLQKDYQPLLHTARRVIREIAWAWRQCEKVCTMHKCAASLSQIYGIYLNDVDDDEDDDGDCGDDADNNDDDEDYF